jgi:hypothetical protein
MDSKNIKNKTIIKEYIDLINQIYRKPTDKILPRENLINPTRIIEALRKRYVEGYNPEILKHRQLDRDRSKLEYDKAYQESEQVKREYSRIESESKKIGSVPDEIKLRLAELKTKLESVNKIVKRAHDKYHAVDPILDTFVIPKVQDVDEAVTYFLGHIMRDYPVFSDIFKIKFNEILECTEGHERRKESVDAVLKLQFPFYVHEQIDVNELNVPIGLEELFKVFTADETLDGVNCDVCKGRKTHKKGMKIVGEGPDILMILIGRSNIFGQMIEKSLAFPKRLDLSKVTDNLAVGKYILVGIVYHKNGHYVSDFWNPIKTCKKSDILSDLKPPNCTAKPRWYHADDSKISEIDEPNMQSKNAYMLVYQRARKQEEWTERILKLKKQYEGSN